MSNQCKGCCHEPRAVVPLEGVRGRTRSEGSPRESHGGRGRPRARRDLVLGAVRTATPPASFGDTSCRGAAACAPARGRRRRHAAHRAAGEQPAPGHRCGQRRRGCGAGRRRSRLREREAEAGGHLGSRFGRVGREHARGLPSPRGGRFWLSQCVVAAPRRRQRGAGRAIGSQWGVAGVADGSARSMRDVADPTRRDGGGAARNDRHGGPIGRRAPERASGLRGGRFDGSPPLLHVLGPATRRHRSSWSATR